MLCSWQAVEIELERKVGNPPVHAELLELFRRAEIPSHIRASIATELGLAHYKPAKEALIAGLSDVHAGIRVACMFALANDWELPEIGSNLIEILLNDEHEFVRMAAANGLGAIRCHDALPALKWVILNDDFDMTLRESAYEAVLQILGMNDDFGPIEDEDSPIRIDWELVRNL